MRRALLAIVAAIAFAAPLTAQTPSPPPDQLTQLTGEALRAAFADKTHYGTYKSEREATGTNLFTETMSADGRTDYREGARRIGGDWWVQGDTLMCFTYDDDDYSSCFHIYKSGTCLYGYSPRNTTPAGPVDTNLWVAKTISKGSISTCDDLIG